MRNRFPWFQRLRLFNDWQSAHDSFPALATVGIVIALALGAASIEQIPTEQQGRWWRILFWLVAASLFGLVYEWQRAYRKAKAEAGSPLERFDARDLSPYAACAMVVFIASAVLFRAPDAPAHQPVASRPSASPIPQSAPKRRQSSLVHGAPIPRNPTRAPQDIATAPALAIRSLKPPPPTAAPRVRIPVIVATASERPFETKRTDGSRSRSAVQPAPVVPTPAASALGVTSQNQSGGVTAGSIGTVNQNVNTAHSKYVKGLQEYYARGVMLRVAALSATITDDQIDKSEKDATVWANETLQWTQANMGNAAAARFLDRSGYGSFGFALSGLHKDGEQVKRDNVINALSDWLKNLDLLMHSTAYDP